MNRKKRSIVSSHFFSVAWTWPGSSVLFIVQVYNDVDVFIVCLVNDAHGSPRERRKSSLTANVAGKLIILFLPFPPCPHFNAHISLAVDNRKLMPFVVLLIISFPCSFLSSFLPQTPQIRCQFVKIELQQNFHAIWF